MAELRSGTIIDTNYEILECLGSGGIGTVYHARDLQNNQDVALKILNTSVDQGETRRRFAREFEILSRVQHTRIVRAHQWGMYKDRPYFCMDYLTGRSLSELISDSAEREVFKEERLLPLIRQIGEGLGHIHEQGMVHRDLKPSNIMVCETDDEDGFSAVILDLGLARFRETQEMLIESKAASGTIEYMSPEQIKGRWVDSRSDLYSLGVMIYEILTGLPPFTGKSVGSVALGHLKEQPQPPQIDRDKTPKQLQDIVMKLLEKDPGNRYGSVWGLLESVQDIDPGADKQVWANILPDSFPADLTLYPQFLGRDKETRMLQQALKNAQQGVRQFVVISGEAGTGKSELVEELQGEARAYGMHVLAGICRKAAGRAYGPVIDALEGRAGKTLGFLDQRSSEERADPYAARELLAETLEKLSQEQPVLFCIEDVQWADDLTLQFLKFLERGPGQVSLIVCLTCRKSAEEPWPNTVGDLLSTDEKQDTLHIPLAGLDSKETARLAASMLGEEDVPGEVAEALYKATGGNPLFAVELVRAWVAEDVVSRTQDGRWQWKPIPKTLLPSGVAEAIEPQLTNLSPEQRETLEYASVFQGDFSFDLVLGLSQSDELELLKVLESLVRLGFLRETEDKERRYRFSHIMLQQSVYQKLSENRRRNLHLVTGNLLEKSYQEGKARVLDDLAYHFSRSDDKGRKILYLTKAGQYALHSLDFSRAAGLLGGVLEMHEEDIASQTQTSGEQESYLELLCDHTEALIGCGQIQDAYEESSKVVELASDDVLAQSARALSLFGAVCISLRETEKPEKALLDALGIYQKLEDVEGEITTLARLTTLSEIKGNVEDAVKYHHLIAEKCRNSGGPVYKARAFNSLAYAALLEHRLKDAQSLLESALHLLKQTDDRCYKYTCLLQLCNVDSCIGNFGRAEEALQILQRLWYRRGAKGAEARIALRQASLALENREFNKAEAYASKAGSLSAETADQHGIYQAYSLLAETMAEKGDIGQARTFVDKAQPATEIDGISSITARIGIAKALAASGCYEEAAKIFDKAVEGYDKTRGFGKSRALLCAGEFYLQHGKTDIAQRYLDAAREAFSDMGAAHFAEKAEALLQQTAGPDNKAQLWDRWTESLSQQRLVMLCDVSRDLTAMLDLDLVLDRGLERLLAVSQAERAIIALKDLTSQAFHVQVARSHNLGRRAAEAISRSVILEVIEQNKPVLSLDAQSDDRFRKSQSVTDYGIRAVLCVPLYHTEAGVVGALYLDHRELEGVFSDEDLKFLYGLGNLMAIAILNARNHTQLKERVYNLQKQVEGRYNLDGLVGQSKAMQEVFARIEQAANTDATVLICGETGTGKELAARAIHYNSRRKNSPFLSQNCGAFPAELLQSELFGHAEGAFTGAVADRSGLFEAASEGTFFLDEIGDASPQVQSNLLRVLQNGEFRRVGENDPRKVDVRIIAATHRDLEAEVRHGHFRKDLYFRLRVLEIRMPALREWAEDIPFLAGHLLKQESEKAKKKVNGFTTSAIQALINHTWPGNVRELENEIRRAVALVKEGGEITPDLFSDQIISRIQVKGGLLRSRVDAFERRLITETLEDCNGNITQAAALLGLTRRGLQKKILRLGLREGHN